MLASLGIGPLELREGEAGRMSRIPATIASADHKHD